MHSSALLSAVCYSVLIAGVPAAILDRVVILRKEASIHDGRTER